MIAEGLGPLILTAVLVAGFVLGNWLIGPIMRRHDPGEPSPIWPGVAVAAFTASAMLAAALLLGLLDEPAMPAGYCTESSFTP
jgi:Kef-type K+ transport system membrane component KefB